MAYDEDMLFASLYTSFFDSLSNFAEKIVNDKEAAKDIVCSVFSTLCENRKFLDIDSLERYLWNSVRNNCLNYLDLAHVKHKVSVDVHDLLDLYHPKDDNDPLSILEKEEVRRAIEEAIAQLPPKCREAFQLANLEDLSYLEVAKKMGISVKTVYKYIAIAKEKLRVILVKKGRL